VPRNRRNERFLDETELPVPEQIGPRIDGVEQYTCSNDSWSQKGEIIALARLAEDRSKAQTKSDQKNEGLGKSRHNPTSGAQKTSDLSEPKAE